MKSDRRHELQDNALAKWLAPKVEAIKPYGKLILAGIVVIVAAVVTLLLVLRSQRASEEQAWQDLLTLTSPMEYGEQIDGEVDAKLYQLIEDHEGTSVALRAQLFLADQARTRGTELLFSDTMLTSQTRLDEARAKLDEAVKLYGEAAEAANDVSIIDRAKYYHAQTLFSKFALTRNPADLNAARDLYDAVAKTDGLFSQLAQDNIDILDSEQGGWTWLGLAIDDKAKRDFALPNPGAGSPFGLPGAFDGGTGLPSQDDLFPGLPGLDPTGGN